MSLAPEYPRIITIGNRELTPLRHWRKVALPLCGAAGGWMAFDDTKLIHHGQLQNVAQGFLIGAMLLALAWRGVERPRQAFGVMLGWYLGACAALPGIWMHFFGGQSWAGVAVWLLLAALLSATYALSLLAPHGARFGIVIGIILTALPPLGWIGLASPIFIAGAMFPGLGLLGIALLFTFFLLSGLRNRVGDTLAIGMVMWGALHAALPSPKAPADSWGMLTFDGAYPPKATFRDIFPRQDQIKAQVLDALRAGAKLIVIPEGSDPAWDDGQAFYWKDVAGAARRHNAQVLLGVYTAGFPPDRSQDGLVDLASGALYPASIPMPIGMWKPWSRDRWERNFPPAFSRVEILPTRYGPAAYSICYENLIPWPLVRAMLSSQHPRLLIAADNQWFAAGSLSRPQMRSLQMQAAIWGIPLIRAINWPVPR